MPPEHSEMNPDDLVKRLDQQQKQIADLTSAAQNLARAIFLIVTPGKSEDEQSKGYDYYLEAAKVLFPKE